MKLLEGEKGTMYIVQSVKGEKEIKNFLFTLGCYEGEEISIIKKLHSNLIINIKGTRYAVDKNLAKLIEVI